jgi:hypothetical protein
MGTSVRLSCDSATTTECVGPLLLRSSWCTLKTATYGQGSVLLVPGLTCASVGVLAHYGVGEVCLAVMLVGSVEGGIDRLQRFACGACCDPQIRVITE